MSNPLQNWFQTPQRWTKRVLWRTRYGDPTYLCKAASSTCLLGGISLLMNFGLLPSINREGVERELLKSIQRQFPDRVQNYSVDFMSTTRVRENITLFNDHEETSFDDILSVVKDLNWEEAIS